MTGSLNIADRHSRQATGLGDGFGLTVRVITGPLPTVADEQLAACLINLLCRMVGTVAAIDLRADDATLGVPLPNGVGVGPAFERLQALANWVVGDAVPVLSNVKADRTFTISLDRTVPEEDCDLYVAGLGWLACVGTSPPKRQNADPQNPIGAFFAASLAAGEVFKRARGLTGRGTFAANHGYGLWDGTTGPLDDLRDGPLLNQCSIDPLYLVGAGAVGQGIIVLLGASQIETFAVTIDDDIHDDTNLNRCFVAGIDDIDDPKIEAVARFRQLAGIKGTEFRGTLQQFLRNGPTAGMPMTLREQQQQDKFGLIVSAVDKNTSRRDIAGLAPAVVVGGSTDQLTAKAMTYEQSANGPCLACFNPAEEEGDRRRQLEQQIRGMAEEGARTFLATMDIASDEIQAVIAYVRDAPGCGSVGERVLGGLATSSPREFSVSFVSMAAAVFAFTRLIQASSGCGSRKTMSSFNFRKLSYSDDGLPVEVNCAYCF